MSGSKITINEGIVIELLDALIESDEGREMGPEMVTLLKKIKKKCSKKGDLCVEYSSKENLGGRFYAQGGVSLQALPQRLRQIISVPAYDIDLVNAHPTLLVQLCRKHYIPCPSLNDYVTRRDQWLTGDLGCSRDEMKARCLRALYGSEEESSSEQVKSLQKECADIAAIFSTSLADSIEEYTKLKEAVRAKNPEKSERQLQFSFLSYVLQREEARVIRKTMDAIHDKFKVKIQAYIFDGFLVRKRNCPAPLVLIDYMNTVASADGVRFAQKPFQCPEDFAPPPPIENDEPETDVQALRMLEAKYPGHLRMDGATKMVYDPDTGIWLGDAGAQGAFMRLAGRAFGDGSKYGGSVNAMRSAFNAMSMLPDDSAFFTAARRKTIGKLLFKDGIYDKEGVPDAASAPESSGQQSGGAGIGKKIPFSPEYCFRYFVPHDIPTEEPENVDVVQAFMFDQPYKMPDVALYMKQLLMRSLFGLGGEQVIFEVGEGSQGKSARSNAVATAFGRGYVQSLNGSAIAADKKADPGKAAPQLNIFEDSRLVYLAEPDPSLALDMTLLKRLTGRDPISGRDLYKGYRTFETRAATWFLCNNIPRLSECEVTFMKKRFRQIDNDVRYLDEIVYQEFLDKGKTEDQLAELHMYRADEKRYQTVLQSSPALIWLILNEPLKSLAEVTPRSVLEASNATVEERDPLKQRFDKEFEFTGKIGDRVASSDLVQTLNLDARMLAKKLKSWGAVTSSQSMRIDGKVIQGYRGIKRKRDEPDDGSTPGEEVLHPQVHPPSPTQLGE